MSLKVLYVAGAGRSGSLLLNNVLGSVEGDFSCGEMYHLYRTPATQRHCGCGAILSECEVWRPILEQVSDRDLMRWQQQMLGLRNRVARTRYLPLWLVPQTRRRMIALSAEYRQQLERLYFSVAANTQTQVIVDASKVATYLAVLHHIPSLELFVVHLTRDPRAVAYSWQRGKRVHTPVGEIAIPAVSPLRGAIRWLVHNLAVEACQSTFRLPSLRVRYEDLVLKPKETAEAILSFIGEKRELSHIHGRTVVMGIQHNVGGNPGRFQTGAVTLELDDEWRAHMHPLLRASVAVLTAPLLHRYGYVRSL